MKRSLLSFIIVVSLLSMILVGCAKTEAPADSGSDREESTAEQVELMISAAASLTNVAEDLTDLYAEVAPNVKLTFTFGSSGALQTQIEEGAPADVFFSAALKQMKALEDGGYVLDGTKKDLLINEVVLITPKGNPAKVESFEDAATDKVKTIALGDPASVPVGQYSEEVFNHLGILDKVTPKANYGTDVVQVLTWVESGEVDCGIVYATDAAASDKIDVISSAPEGSHKIVTYPVAVVKSSKKSEEAKEFVDFLSSDQARAAFESYGFTINK
ncbi:MAG: molybdate ABC transporter substrate-binding protein [Bacillota bacterium]|jgi:molybdate transport system substrate-binding protein